MDMILGRGRIYGICRIVTSVPILSVLVVLLLEIWLRQGNPADAMNFRNVDAWAVPEKLELCRRLRPQVVLIGSSLVLVLDQDQAGHHFLTGYDPTYLRGVLDQATGKNICCVNLATGAQMTSESYFLLEALCNQRHHPAVVIYGIAMRDFVQERLSREWTTESFNSIAPFAPLTAARNVYSAECLKEFLLCHYFYLYRNRGDFKYMFSAWAKEFLEGCPLLLDFPFMRLGEDCIWHPSKQGYLLENWVPRNLEAYFQKIKQIHPQALTNYFKNTQIHAYKLKTFATPRLSAHYFRCLQELCKGKNITLVVVTMPLSPATSSVVPAIPMQMFRHYLEQGQAAGPYKFIDLWADPRFVDADYTDGVHFTYNGTKKFGDIFLQQLQERFPEVINQMATQTQGAR
jgi:hypothetical protein